MGPHADVEGPGRPLPLVETHADVGEDLKADETAFPRAPCRIIAARGS